MGRFPEELRGLPGRPRRAPPAAPWYACLGRTRRAFQTHPYVQRVAEGATNRASLALGRRLDATAGACWLDRSGAEIVLAGSVEETNATDLEWPALIYRGGGGGGGGGGPRARVAYVATEGLEFETAEFYAPEIAALGGREAWERAHYERPEVWRACLGRQPTPSPPSVARPGLSPQARRSGAGATGGSLYLRCEYVRWRRRERCCSTRSAWGGRSRARSAGPAAVVARAGGGTGPGGPGRSIMAGRGPDARRDGAGRAGSTSTSSRLRLAPPRMPRGAGDLPIGLRDAAGPGHPAQRAAARNTCPIGKHQAPCGPIVYDLPPAAKVGAGE